MNLHQSTIRTIVTVAGVGLHTGKDVKMTFHPAAPNHGIVFRRIDIAEKPLVRASIQNVSDVSRGTTLAENGFRVCTVEHVMAAIAGMEIDNLLIDLDNEETPIMDGSARVFTQAFLAVGIQNQGIKRDIIDIRRKIEFTNGNGVQLTIIPNNTFELEVNIDYNSDILGKQKAQLSQISQFSTEIADSRTFCFLHELEMLLNQNLIKGGDLNNAIVVVDKKVSKKKMNHLAKLFNKPTVEVREEGILNNLELRHNNEPARHKLLDVIGDLALLGSPIKGKIIATKPGHAANIEFAKNMMKEIKNFKTVGAPYYDPNTPPVKDINAIRNFLPHKYPFLLIDKIIELNDHRVVGIKNVTFNENFFPGHFPDEPVMPGVLIIESMAQTGGILVMNSVPDPENYMTYFLKIDKAKFKNKVVPGDTMILEMELLNPIRRGICEMKGTVWVGDKIVTQAELVAQIIRKEP